jgi:hypothetical protein
MLSLVCSSNFVLAFDIEELLKSLFRSVSAKTSGVKATVLCLFSSGKLFSMQKIKLELA